MLEAGIYELPFDSDVIEFVAKALISLGVNDFSNIAVVFPGRRPSVYLRQKLFELLRKPYVPPKIFQIEEFLTEIATISGAFGRILSPLEAASVIFQLAQQNGFSIAKEFKDFGEFAFWGVKLASAFTEFDQELISNEKLMDLPALAEYEDIQVKVKHLWTELPKLKRAFEEVAERKGFLTRGMIYRKAAEFATEHPSEAFGDFDFVIFAGFFALREAEKAVVKAAINSSKGCMVWQSDGQTWSPFVELTKELKLKPIKVNESTSSPSIQFHAGVDTHAEAAVVRQILTDVLEGKSGHIDPREVAIVLPREDALMPVLWEAISFFDVHFNVSMGYPLKRTPIAGLFELILRAQESRQGSLYYAKDYLHVVLHPYIKNIEIDGDSALMRIGIQKIDELVRSKQLQFIDLEELEIEPQLYKAVSSYAVSTHGRSKGQKLVDGFYQALKRIHRLAFRNFEKISTFRGLAENSLALVEFIVQNTSIENYPFASEFLGRFTSALHELRDALFADEQLAHPPLFAIFRHHIASKSVPFEGTPLSGVQILGILETRVLNFKTVILLDANEGVIPSITPHDPLMPRPVRRSLGLPDIQEQEEVFRYHFTRLIKGAKNAHVIYQQNDTSVRSRFVEALIWQAELEAGEIGKFDPQVKQFYVGLSQPNPTVVQKSKEVKDLLNSMWFSPSAIDTYMWCPLRFYYGYVLRLKEHDELRPEIQSDIIGQLVHEILEKFYRRIRRFGKINLSNFDRYAEILESEINRAFAKTFTLKTGEVILLHELARHRLRKFVYSDIEHAGGEFEIIGLERWFSRELELNGRRFRLKGRVDRIDRRSVEFDHLGGNPIYIVDYKTGATVQKPRMSKLETVLSDRKEMKKLIRSFQLPVYLMLYKGDRTALSWEQLNAELLIVRGKDEKYALFNSENRTHFMEDIFKPSLGNLLSEILDPDVPFEPDDEDKNYCRSCPYRILCGISV